MQTTEQHAADTKLAEGPSRPAQQGGETAEACSVATPNAAVGSESGEILHAAGVSELRPLAAEPEVFFTLDANLAGHRSSNAPAAFGTDDASRPPLPSGGRLAEVSLPAPFLIAAGAALSAELPTRGFSFGYDCAEGAVMPYADEYGRAINPRYGTLGGEVTNAAGALFAPQVLSGNRGIRTEAVVMGVADVS